ncbi:MAG: acetate kinase, partial [Chloroflexota bacterium]|nr:acetate kinase [Chloroflexota bacterium]
GDMRELLAARTAGNERARLALEIFTARVREGIGALAVALGGLDVLVFTAGIGEHVPEIRAEICQPLRWLGVELDAARNAAAGPDVDIATETSAIRVFVIRTREELMIARETRRVLAHQSG